MGRENLFWGFAPEWGIKLNTAWKITKLRDYFQIRNAFQSKASHGIVPVEMLNLRMQLSLCPSGQENRKIVLLLFIVFPDRHSRLFQLIRERFKIFWRDAECIVGVVLSSGAM